MATTDLSTTNLFLGLIAISSLVQMLLIKTVQEQQLPLAAVRLHGILDDVKGVTSTAQTQADRIEGFTRWALRAIRRGARDV